MCSSSRERLCSFLWAIGRYCVPMSNIHARAAKFTHNLPWDISDLDALETTGWEPLSTQYKKKLLTLMYKVNCRITSDKITNLFSIANPHYNLRNSNHFALPRFNLDTGRNSIRYRGPIAWATTPTCLKHATSLKNFKKLLKQRRHKLFIKNISFGKEACMVSHKDQDFTYF